jgi:hypothetical protein
VIQRIVATVVATLILWFVWWFFGQLLLLWLVYGAAKGHQIAAVAAGLIFWVVVIAIPPFVWFRFRHVQENPDR